MEIKDIIRKRREELNLTYEQLGSMVGVGKSTVRKWETGMIENMRRDNIVALSKALNISPAVLMGLDIENEEIIDDTKTIIKGFKENEELFNSMLSHGEESFKSFTEYLYSTFSNEINVFGDEFTAIDIITLYEYINKIISFELSKVTDSKQKTSKEKDNITEITATKEELQTLHDLNPTLLAAHDDDLTQYEKTEMDRRILEALMKRK